MDWRVYHGSVEQRDFALGCMTQCLISGWGRNTIEIVATQRGMSISDARTLFPNGAKDVIGLISTVSDASMQAAFHETNAANLAEVIDERFAQNHNLKAMVRKVMLFDIFHPIQAIGRMQKTAQAMYECVGDNEQKASLRLLLNVTYTIIVFRWLRDSGLEDSETKQFTRRALKLARLMAG